MRNTMTPTDQLRNELIKDHWLFNYSWRGVKLATLEKMYDVPQADILSMMRDIAHKYDPPNAPDNGCRCRSCGMRIVWGKTEGEKPIPLDPPVLTIVTARGEVVKGRESHFVSCPDASGNRKE